MARAERKPIGAVAARAWTTDLVHAMVWFEVEK